MAVEQKNWKPNESVAVAEASTRLPNNDDHRNARPVGRKTRTKVVPGMVLRHTYVLCTAALNIEQGPIGGPRDTDNQKNYQATDTISILDGTQKLSFRTYI